MNAEITARLTLPDADYPQTPYSDQLALTDGAIWIVWWGSDPNWLVRVDATGGSISKEKLPYPVTLAAGDGGLWAIGPYGGAPLPEFTTLFRVDVTTGTLATLVKVRGGTGDIAAGLGSLWVDGAGGLWRVDQASGRRIDILTRDPEAFGLMARCGALWSAGSNGENTELSRLDLANGATLTRFVTDGWAGQPVGTPDECWLATETSVQRLDLDGDLSAPTVRWTDRKIYVAGASIWTLNGNIIKRIEPHTGTPVEPGWRIDANLLDSSEKGGHLEFRDAGGFLWLLNRDQVIRFDIPTG